MPYALRDIRKSYGDLAVIDGFSLDFPPGKVTAVLGPSGCGKTTLLNILSGLLKADSGDRSGFDAALISCVFQEPRLAPSLSARQNVELVLRASLPPVERRDRALRFLSAVGLRNAMDLKPRELSGGMRQRTALARAFAYPADILLMDEPFQSVDLRTRIDLMDAFLSLQASDPRTVVFVTHEVREALYLGDIIIVLSDKPARILDRKELLLPHERRRFGSADLADMEADLYRTILSDSVGPASSRPEDAERKPRGPLP